MTATKTSLHSAEAGRGQVVTQTTDGLLQSPSVPAFAASDCPR